MYLNYIKIKIMANFNVYDLWYNNIPEGWEDLNVDNELFFLNKLLKKDYDKLLPFKNYVFSSFHKIKPNDIKLVIMDENPRLGIINGDSKDIGIPFYNNFFGNDYNAKKLLKLMNKNENDPIINLFNSNVFLIHSSLTCELQNNKKHYYIWKDFLFKVFDYLNKLNPKIIYIIFGNQIYNENDFLGKSSKIYQFKSFYDKKLIELFKEDFMIEFFK